VLRELLKNEAAAAVILYDDGDEPGSSSKGLNAIDRERPQTGRGVFWRFFDWIDKSSFEVAADAFTTFRVGSIYLKSLICQPFSTTGTCPLPSSIQHLHTLHIY
jgi:hypothetical protein